MRTPVKNFRMFTQIILQVPKQLKLDTFEGVFVIRLQHKRHNFGQWESFLGPVDIPSMGFSWASFDGDVRFGLYKPTMRTNFGEISYFEFTKLQILTSFARGGTLYCVPRYALLLNLGTGSKSVVQWVHGSTSLARDSTVSSSLYCTESTDTLQPVWFRVSSNCRGAQVVAIVFASRPFLLFMCKFVHISFLKLNK